MLRNGTTFLADRRFFYDCTKNAVCDLCFDEFGISNENNLSRSISNSPIYMKDNIKQIINNNITNFNANNNSNSNNNNSINPKGKTKSKNVNNNACIVKEKVVNQEKSKFKMDTDTTNDKQKPDTENVKMFVGQVPKSMDEVQLQELFEKYGPVRSINVLRDKSTGISKGCCFVTFHSSQAALKAQVALHNVKTFSGMYSPIQMKPADSRNRRKRKLFIGMLKKHVDETELKKLLEVHGAIEECAVLRDKNGQSKGCAFVTFATKPAAISAIKALSEATSNMVVKFADTRREKLRKKIQRIQTNLWNLARVINEPQQQTSTTTSAPIIINSSQQTIPVVGTDATTASLQLLKQLQSVTLHQPLPENINMLTNTPDSAVAAAAAGLIPPLNVQNLDSIVGIGQTNYLNNPGTAQLTNTAALLWSPLNPLASAYMSTGATLPQLGSGKQIEGPEGCNLFIYNLPQKFTDIDLVSTFFPFGNVISARVFIDKKTNLSKCFGFVSFDNKESAQVAIKAMNGFQIGTKCLQVQLKKPKDSSKQH